MTETPPGPAFPGNVPGVTRDANGTFWLDTDDGNFVAAARTHLAAAGTLANKNHLIDAAQVHATLAVEKAVRDLTQVLLDTRKTS